MKKSIAGLAVPMLLVSAIAVGEAADGTVAGGPLVELPTLISLGFEWPIQGDDNRNAVATIEYRRKGESGWKRGLDLLRLQGEETFLRGALDYTAPNITDGYSGKAPGLGAYEYGQPEPHYGPREPVTMR